MKSLKKELMERFGMDGCGVLEKVEWLGRKGTEITVEEFESWSGTALDYRVENEHGTEDCQVTLIDENCEDFDITLEIKNEVITHSYF